jgi:hypothetical protein
MSFRSIPPKKVPHAKVQYLPNIRSRALEVTLGSSTDPNLGHNPIKFLKKRMEEI